MPILEVRNIRKSFGNNEVLRGVGFTMEKGEVLAIIGSSGSGKTTRCAASIFWNGPTPGRFSLTGNAV